MANSRPWRWACIPTSVLRVLIRPRHLAGAIELVDHMPDVRFVVDHGAKPDIARWRPGDTDYRAWRDAMDKLARHQRVDCKLSGLVTEAARDWSPDDLRPYTDALLEMFGLTRLLWGSDWPVALGAGPYSRWAECAESLLGRLPAEESAAIFGGNAARFYRLRRVG